MSTVINEANPLMFTLLIAAAMIAAWAVAWRWGRSLPEETREESSNKFSDAILALLGLLLAFTFSMSLVKHEQRRQMVVTDSNAIGDFYTCASLLSEPERSKLMSLVQKYAEHRLSLANPSITEDVLQQNLKQIHEIHREMQSLVKDALDAGTPIGVPLVNTLNSLTSSHASRLAAVHDRLPMSIVLLLTLTAVVANSLIGRYQGAAREWRPGATFSFTLLVCMVIWVTLDLNHPRRGWITVSQEPIQQLIESMK